MIKMPPSRRDTSILPELENLDRRGFIWLWSYLQLRYNSNLNHLTFDVEGQFQRQVNQAIKAIPMPNLARSLVSLYNQTAIDASHFDWIKSSNERLVQWLMFETQNPWPIFGLQEGNRFRYCIDQTLPPQISLCETIIARCDLWYATPEEKRQNLVRLNSNWGSIKADTGRLMNWLERGNEKQHEWVLDYIRRKGNPATTTNIPELSSSYNTILSWLECWASLPAENELFIRTMAQRWSQAKYKKKLRGKQHNFILTAETNNQLNNLKKRWGISRNQIIERLIQAKYWEEEAQPPGIRNAEAPQISYDTQ